MPNDAPISAKDCLSGREVSEPRLSPDAGRLAWVRGDVDGARIVVRTLDDDIVEKASPWSVRSGRSLGGGCFDWMPDGQRIVAVTADGDLSLWNLSDESEQLLVSGSFVSLSAPAPSPAGRHVAYVVDQAEIRVVAILDGSTRRVDSGEFAFAFDPVWWNDTIVWQAWSPPHMPWNESCLVSEGGIVRHAPATQHQQPQSNVDGRTLGWLDDSNGWLNVTVKEGRRVNEPFEHGGPTWGERQRSWCFDADGTRLAFVRNEGGFGRLCTCDLESGIVVERAKAVHGQLSWRGERLAAVRTGGRTPSQVVVYDTRSEEWKRNTIEIGATFDWSASDALVEPELLRFATDDGFELHARLYSSPHRSSNTAGIRRLLCWIHGGPTDQWQVTFMPRFAYWLDRGYDILVPDFRGSTGHGRAFTEAMNGRWGLTDIDDVEQILAAVASRPGYSGSTTAVMGSSAGGMTALRLAARRSNLVAAVVAAYPVTDIAGLDEVTHRFEAHYNRSLIGSPDETERLSKERSPFAHIDQLARVPLLVFHGTHDPVVPFDHSRRLVDELRRRGAEVDLVAFGGEGHGFRKLENKIEEFELTEQFLERHLGGRSPD